MLLFLSESLLPTVINDLLHILQGCKFLFCFPLFICFLYWLNVFSNTSGDFTPARATSMSSLSLCSSHMDITGCPLLAPHLHRPQGFCYSQSSLAWDHSEIILARFSGLRSMAGRGELLHETSMWWSNLSHTLQPGGVSWIAAGCTQHWHWKQEHKASFFSKQVKAQVNEVQQSISHRFLSRQRER